MEMNEKDIAKAVGGTAEGTAITIHYPDDPACEMLEFNNPNYETIKAMVPSFQGTCVMCTHFKLNPGAHDPYMCELGK